ncbi:MAG: HDOD domain-containing protein [Gemmatimonadales bacterium]
MGQTGDRERRALFIEADAATAAIIERDLAACGRPWSATILPTTEDGLLECRREPYDLVVADAGAPGRSGAEFLHRIAESVPGAVRVLVADQARENAAIRGAASAHQVLSKPFQPGVIHGMLQMATDLGDLLANPVATATVGELESLPSIPAAYLRLSELLARDDVTIAGLTEVVQGDTSLSARVLQMANSPYFGTGTAVVSLERAVSVLGSRLIKSLAMVDGMFRSVDHMALPLEFDPRIEQEHASAVGGLARRLAGPARGDAAFSAGILHDLGRLLLAVRAPEKFEDVVARATESGQSMLVAERELLGTDHAELGSYLLAAWGLPWTIISGVRHHHQPSRERERQGVAVFVHLADCLLREVKPEGALYPAPLDAGAVSGLGRDADLPGWRGLVAQAAATEAQPG